MPKKVELGEVDEGLVGDIDRRAVGDQQSDAAQRGEGRQRHDEGWQAHLGDAEAVEHPDGKANEDGDDDR